MEKEDETLVVVGFGWVGQANALAFSRAGYNVSYFDIQEPKLHYTDRYKADYAAIKRLPSVLAADGKNTWYVVCVGDRVTDDGEQDISAITKALDSLRGAQGGVILRSTVLPGKLASLPFHYYVPEFLHEKKAVEECMKPQYFVVGSRDILDYSPSFFMKWHEAANKSFFGTPEEAAYIKYLSNTWNALRIAFVNEFGNAIALPTSQGNIAQVERVINFMFEEKSYVRYGRSYGGHCLPKDTHAFTTWFRKQGRPLSVLEGAHVSNLEHKKLEANAPNLREWFSEWVRPPMSGRAALHALNAAVWRKAGEIIGKPFRRNS